MDEVILSNWDYIQAMAKIRMMNNRIKALEGLSESQRSLIDELQEALRRERERKYAIPLR